MSGEFCREAAVLIFVFGNLDIWFKSFSGELDKLPLPPGAIFKHVIWVFGVAVLFEIVGMFFEKRWRQNERRPRIDPGAVCWLRWHTSFGWFYL
jgi:hypothetical protein